MSFQDNLFRVRRSVISRTGDTLDQPILLSRSPVETDEAATKLYADTVGGTGAFLIRPFIAGRYYNSPFGRSINATNTPSQEAWCAIIYAGGPMTWDRVLMTTPANGSGNYEVGVMELDNDLRGGAYWTWRSTILPVPSTGVNYIEHEQTLSTTTNWVGVAGWRTAAASQLPKVVASVYSPFGDTDSALGGAFGGAMLRSNNPTASALGLGRWAPSSFIPDRGTKMSPSHALRLASVDA